MLTPEAAAEQLKQWRDPSRAEARLAEIKALPDELRRIAFAAAGLNAAGRLCDYRQAVEDHKFRMEQARLLDRLAEGERLRVFRVLLGDLDRCAERTWQHLQSMPYQPGSARRAYRVPRHPERTLYRRFEFLKDFVALTRDLRPDVLSVTWLAAWAPHLGYGGDDEIGRMLAAVIDAGGPEADEVFDVLTRSARNEHEIGGMGRHVTRGLLSAGRPDGWELVENLLLAAQRQEGLRQVILETVDEAHPQAFRRMLRLIREHDLARFSAVTRAVNVWLGMEWDSSESTAVNRVLDRADVLLGDADERRRALGGTSASDAWLALWSAATEDAVATIADAVPLLAHKSVEFRFIAARHLLSIGLPETLPHLLTACDDPDLRVAATAMTDITVDGEQLQDRDLCERIVGVFERLFARLPGKSQELEPLVWPWAKTHAWRNLAAHCLTLYLGPVSPLRLVPLLRDMDQYSRRNVIEALAKLETWDDVTRRTLLDLAGDAATDVRIAALNALDARGILPHEAPQLESYLTRKAPDLRQGVVALLLALPDEAALASARRLLAAKHPQQRLAGLELLRQLADEGRQRDVCQSAATEWQAQQRRITPDEQVQLDGIAAAGRAAITLDNALGLLNPAERTPAVPPQPRDVRCMTPAALALLKSLDALVHDHREETIRFGDYQGEQQESLLGAVQYGFPYPDTTEPIKKQLTRLPLRHVWEAWYEQRPAELRDADGLEFVRASAWLELSGRWEWDRLQEWTDGEPSRQPAADFSLGGQERFEPAYPVTERLLYWLLFMDRPGGAIDFTLDVLETLYALVPEQDLRQPDDSEDDGQSARRYHGPQQTWRDFPPISVWQKELDRASGVEMPRRTREQTARRWRLARWFDEPFPGSPRRRGDFSVLIDAYRQHDATLADVADALLGRRETDRYYGRQSFDALRWQTFPRPGKDDQALRSKFPEIAALVESCRDRIYEIELARGEAPTAATAPAWALGAIFGCERLRQLLAALGKNGFRPRVGWREENTLSKPATLTHLAQIAYPAPDDTPQRFREVMAEAVKQGEFPEERILQLAFLAPQWTQHIAHFFGWDGFAEALYWFLAHMKYVSGGTQEAALSADYQDEEVKSGDGRPKRHISAWDRLIMERTPLPEADRDAGAVDVAWFRRTYAQLTPKRWLEMAAAARFAANPAQAKRAAFIADVLLGKASRRELIQSIRGRKLKENVRLLGLLPLATGTKRDRDVAERYEILQEYRRYARQLSAMTQGDALRACEIGMDNLARTAGYADPLRLEWAQEAAATRDLAKGAVTVAKGDVTMSLALDEQARPQVSIARKGKPVKSLPASHKKESKFVELAERARHLRRQASRMKWSLETAMCRGDTFTGDELGQVCTHALLAPLLERLVLIGEGSMGYPVRRGKALRDHAGRVKPVKKRGEYRIAHPYDLLHGGKWDRWQHECFTAERLQPFKQVFRELYVVTKQERADKTVSRRYSGQQINPQQAHALWGQRGWSVDDGVWKVFHDLGLTVGVEFVYGPGTPLEVEGLTIDTVQFRERDEYRPVRLADVPPRVFSEVMRDMDLVVSVAHRGEVDPEASASTVEMRTNLLRETALLLGLKNVRFKKSSALVDGTLARYSVHLGSGVVHRMPGGAVCIVPVHAQHRGRLFLPFADDDPKTAEVISKVLLLARDEEIQDPTILEQLRRK